MLTMSLFSFKLLSLIIILLASFIAGIYPINKHARLPVQHSFSFGEALANGIFLGVALFHLLPNAEEHFSDIYPNLEYPLSYLICGIGLILMVLLEKVSLSRAEAKHRSGKAIAYLLTLILSVHAFIEGAALGINQSLAETGILFLAIIVHKASEAYALAIQLVKHVDNPKANRKIVSLFACVTPLGILLGAGAAVNFQHSHTGYLLEACFSAFAAGTFLYLSTIHDHDQHLERHPENNLHEFSAMSLGMGLMALVAIWV